MRPALWFASLLALSACAKGSPPASPVSRDGGETDIVRSCEALQDKVQEFYEGLADKSAVPDNRRSEFVSANLHMVMTDCRLSPANRYSCLQQATDVATIENKCLAFLDDEGTVEGFRFGGQSN